MQPAPAVEACQRVNASTLRQMSETERASLFARPTLISGLLADWPGRHEYSEWLDTFEFDSSDPSDPITRTAERIAAESALLAAITSRFPTPDVLRRASAVRLFSLGTSHSMGVSSTVNHGFSYLGMIRGRKVWHLAAPDSPAPSDVRCPPPNGAVGTEPSVVEVVAGTTHRCIQGEGDVMITPTAWWHTTCNMQSVGDASGRILAIGGQDECDLRQCVLPTTRLATHRKDPPHNQACRDEEREVQCEGAHGAQEAMSRIEESGLLLRQPILLVARRVER